MNGNESKLHGSLFKYKIKFRPLDLERRQPLQSHYAGRTSGGVRGRRLTQEDA
jgi:hypothetical protein